MLRIVNGHLGKQALEKLDQPFVGNHPKNVDYSASKETADKELESFNERNLGKLQRLGQMLGERQD